MGKKKDAALHGASKKERKALKAEAARIAAELAARDEARAAKKVKPPKPTKIKAGKTVDLSTLKRKALRELADNPSNLELADAAAAELVRRNGMEQVEAALAAEPVKPTKPSKTPGAGVKGEETHSPAAIVEAADKVLNDPASSEGARTSARAARSKALTGLDDNALKARVKARNARRAELEAAADGIDRDDAEAVRQYNAELADLGGGRFISSTEELAKASEAPTIQDIGAAFNETVHKLAKETATTAGGEVTEHKPKGKRKAKADEMVVEVGGEFLAVPAMETVEVETETGRVFEAGESAGGSSTPVEFGMPSEAPQPLTLEEGRNGYKIMVLKDDGTPDPKTVRQYTRVTTYIDNLEDKSNLEKWKLRVLLEGVALSDTPDEHGRIDEPTVAKVRELMHTRDVTVSKAQKADRKGKLAVGELAKLEVAAQKAFKDALNEMAAELLELGGVHEKANRGTNLHALAELYDAEGMEPINEKLRNEEITPSDHASIVAYAEAMLAAGIKVVASEVVVVNDSLKYAGRFDRIVLAKRPGDARASRVIADIKSGRLDYGLLKVEQQVAMYADGDEYDLETGQRSKHGAIKAWGLVIYLPQGAGTCTIHVLDLNRGRTANKLSAQVRAHRTLAGQVDRAGLGVDLAKPEAVA